MASLKTTIRKANANKISVEIDKEDFESFCNACNLFRKDFLDILTASEKDHQDGRITERDSLFDLIDQ